MVKGLRTAVYHVPDLEAAKKFYNLFAERAPYFDQPFYVGYEIGGFELGLIPDGTPGPGGNVAYWGVSDIVDEVRRLELIGAKVREPIADVGEGIRAAVIADPFGNSIGLIQNPHFSVSKVH